MNDILEEDEAPAWAVKLFEGQQKMEKHMSKIESQGKKDPTTSAAQLTFDNKHLGVMTRIICAMKMLAKRECNDKSPLMSFIDASVWAAISLNKQLPDSSHSTMKAALVMAVADMDTVDKAEFTQTLGLGDLKAMSNTKQGGTNTYTPSSSTSSTSSSTPLNNNGGYKRRRAYNEYVTPQPYNYNMYSQQQMYQPTQPPPPVVSQPSIVTPCTNPACPPYNRHNHSFPQCRAPGGPAHVPRRVIQDHYTHASPMHCHQETQDITPTNTQTRYTYNNTHPRQAHHSTPSYQSSSSKREVSLITIHHYDINKRTNDELKMNQDTHQDKNPNTHDKTQNNTQENINKLNIKTSQITQQESHQAHTHTTQISQKDNHKRHNKTSQAVRHVIDEIQDEPISSHYVTHMIEQEKQARHILKTHKQRHLNPNIPLTPSSMSVDCIVTPTNTSMINTDENIIRQQQEMLLHTNDTQSDSQSSSEPSSHVLRNKIQHKINNNSLPNSGQSDVLSLNNCSSQQMQTLSANQLSQQQSQSSSNSPLTGLNKIKHAPAPLRKMIGHDKKNFNVTNYKTPCGYCTQIGHNAAFCSKRPSERNANNACEQEYVDELMSTPRVDISKFSGMSIENAMKEIHTHAETLNKNNPWKGSSFPRNKLRAKLGYWKAIGATDEVISWIANGISLRMEHEPQHYEFKNHKSYQEHITHIDKEHERHISTGSWRKVDKSFVKVVNPLQVEEQKNKLRMCTDMRYVNAHIAHSKFKLETLQTHVQQIVQQGDVMITTDMEQAYYSMAMHENSWPYMCWKHREEYYCSTVLTFGLSQAPMNFHKTMRTIVRLCRTLGIRVLNYLDDFLWSCKPSQAHTLTIFVKDLLSSLGWKFNDKCVFTPSSKVEFLGMIVDSDKYWVTVPERKVHDIKQLVSTMHTNITQRHRVSVHDLQILGGTIRATSISIKPASAWTREMNRCIARCEESNVTYIDTRHHNMSRLIEELIFWSDFDRHNGASIDHPQHQITVTCDSSVSGYGGTCGSRNISGVLPWKVIGRSSTLREITGLRLLSHHIINEIKTKRVKFVMDSQPAIANLTKGGGVVDELNEEIKLWWKFCEEHQVQPTYEWVPREQNEEADKLSKAHEFPHSMEEIKTNIKEASLSFCRIHNLQTFEAVQYNSIDNRIRELMIEKKTAALVVPEWQAQAWWPILMTEGRPCLLLGTTHEVYNTKSYAQRQGYVHSIPRWRMWLVIYDPNTH